MKRSLLLSLLFIFFFSIFSRGIVGQVYAQVNTYSSCKCVDPAGNGHTANCIQKSAIGGKDQPVVFTCDTNPENPKEQLFCKDAVGTITHHAHQNINAYDIKCLRTAAEKPIEVKETYKNCKCVSPNTTGKDKNKYTCDGGKQGDCKYTETMCVPGGTFNNLDGKHTAEGISCQSVRSKCSCTNPDTVGKNQFSCTDTASGKADTPVGCGDKKICKNSADAVFTTGGLTYKGIACEDEPVDPKETLWPTSPPPPSPPCATFVDGKCTAVKTAFGDISTDPGKFITKVFGILLSISGGLALFLIMRASYIIMTSRGKPEQLQNGRDQMIAAIVGLLFLIFSFVILEVIGTDILKLPIDDYSGAPAATTHNAGGACGRASGATCAAGLTCDTSKDTTRECRRSLDCIGVCKK